MAVTKFEDLPLPIKLVTAGMAACTADLVTFPLDTVKVRLQVQGEKKSSGGPRYTGVLNTMRTVAREEGPKSLYNGLIAGLQRQMFFASIRLGYYENVKVFYQNLILGEKGKRQGVLDIIARICAGITTGAMAVAVAQPTDVVKVRFQAQSKKEIKYSNTTEAYKTIYKEEGLNGLWKGAYPNIARNAVVNVSEIVCYDLVKDMILKRGLMDDHIGCHFTSAVIAGFCATVASSPVDVVKTRFMNSPKGQYSSAIDCAVQTFRKEGPLAFYKGEISNGAIRSDCTEDLANVRLLKSASADLKKNKNFKSVV